MAFSFFTCYNKKHRGFEWGKRGIIMWDLWNRIRYGSVKPSFYEKNRLILDTINAKTLLGENTVLIMINTVFCFLAAFMPIAFYFRIMCISCTLLFLCLYLFFRRHLSVHVEHANFFYAVFYILAFSEALAVSTFFSPGRRMVAVYFVIIMLPVLYIEPPIRSYLTVAGSCVIALFITAKLKKATPSVVTDDAFAILCCFLTCIPFIDMFRNSNLLNIQDRQYLKVKAEKDQLTGLFNPGSSRKMIRQYLENSDESCALFVIDLDNFKHINDTYGHPRGDTLLVKFAEAMQKSFRTEDIIGRIGGDEFTALMKNVDSTEILTKKITSFRKNVQNCCAGTGMEPITCSIGVAVRNGPGDFERLYAQADQALYQTKERGKNSFTISGSGSSGKTES